jgi:sporulation protein YqfD
VDLKGTTAYVKIKERTRKPTINEINEPADVIALHSGIIEKMQVYCGQPLFTEGMMVQKGQVLVSGTFKSEKENIPTYYHHACADITVRLREEKTVIIPKKIIKKIPTGEKKTIFTVNFEKNNVKFSLNSGISYTEYDKIEKKVKIPFLPISVSRIEYNKVDVVEEDADTALLINERRQSFTKSLQDDNMQIESMTENVTDNGSSLSVTFYAECLVRTDKEIPVSH